ncbi:MAG: glutathione S-transferase [Sphingobium sp.]|uniref:glutathione S-transferase family protein n=1 Tax=Sphingomonas melonis TaxID=152682 RepID=UPI0003A9DFDA|nr:glutathione S-transferase N-terminal domain-containing protein [Sphingomonas melonis]MBS47100.1 glutathione S-transferase [Sphingobium sp.]|tara:strand:- start:2024 stop:2698 length:675 start_codon:yes stop_codon:yes gene_type:complete
MIDFYFHSGPNPMKVALMLEETGLPYQMIPVDIFKGDQHIPAFTALNPNAKVPVIVDDGEIVFDSNAILLYLAEKTGQFGAPAGSSRGELLSWLMFIATGLGPYSGQAVHFVKFAPEKLPYAINRYMKEAERHLEILDARLADRSFTLGDSCSIVDFAAWGWVNFAPGIVGEAYSSLSHLRRWHEAMNARPAAGRAIALRDTLKLKSDIDDEARRALFGRTMAL